MFHLEKVHFMMEEMVMDGCTVEKVDQTSWHAPSPWRKVLLLVILKRPPVRNLLFCSVLFKILPDNASVVAAAHFIYI
jgi:hypothetical protein